MTSPPQSPLLGQRQRPMSAMIRPTPRSSSRMSMSSKLGGGSRASDEEGAGKTSVKVVVRVRPPLRPEDPGFELIPQRFQKNTVSVTSPNSLSVDSPQGRKLFVFDRVFPPETTQDGLWEYLQESVNAFVQGYNVSLLAYGQSGAGKSYTMGTAGPDQVEEHQKGVIPRAAAELFERLGEDSGQPKGSGLRTPARYAQQGATKVEKNWSMRATYVEIYNESVRDLLMPQQQGSHFGHDERSSVQIREDTKGRIILTGLRDVEINTIDDLLQCLNLGSAIRQTDATAINAKSSRSHAVFSLNLVQKKPKVASKDDKRLSMPLDMMAGDTGFVTVDSKFHFVDLAGSERLKNTGAQGDRAKEGISINAGLAALGKVISQLSSRSGGGHVSYRDSKLTRLLQDSLGGNAITYMVACVNPAEFHLSETLNTIQYAQRARAIQSKPKIQQLSEEGDLKGQVERLKAEISFLREQLRQANSSDNDGPKKDSARSERSSERERELQNQLLDLQENYTSLSQRHAKLISELSKHRDTDEQETQVSAIDKLKRSKAFADQIEQVVLEYEKTIESLEASLSNTRSSLSTSESTLLEKETKLAYIETVNQQLQTRLTKLMDREASTESYLHDLEAKLSGHSSGEEKNATIITELRKEISRIRETEAAAEDYISTLEERLAEADSDLELMQREIDRLEHVIDRQRSLGKLDNLLHELGTLDHEKNVTEETEDEDEDDSRSVTPVNNRESVEFIDAKTGLSNTEDEDEPKETAAPKNNEITETEKPDKKLHKHIHRVSFDDKPLPAHQYPPPSPAQAEFVNDKLQTVQQELFDLKVEHENTINEFDQLSHNYEDVLRELAMLKDQLDEVRHQQKRSTPASETTSRPESPVMDQEASFLANARVSELKGTEGQPLSSRSLSSELSLVGESPTYSESDSVPATPTFKNGEINGTEPSTEVSDTSAELEALRLEESEKDRIIKELEEEKERLLREHREAMDKVSELQADVGKSRHTSVITPTSTSFNLRRKSSQSLLVLDRAHRSFEGLRKLAIPHLEHEPQLLENFELNLDDAMHELHSRCERIVELEKDVDTLKKDIETKNNMLTGLTRERAHQSMRSSPIDISVVAALERRIEETETENAVLRQRLDASEDQLIIEINELKKKLEASVNEAQDSVRQLLEARAQLTTVQEENAEHVQQITELKGQLTESEHTHNKALESMKSSEKALLDTIKSLEQTISEPDESASKVAQSLAESEEKLKVANEERVKQQDHIIELQKTISELQLMVSEQVETVKGLEEQSTTAKSEMEKRISVQVEQTDKVKLEIEGYKHTIANLEKEIAEHKEASDKSKMDIEKLRVSYEESLQKLQTLSEKESTATVDVKAWEERLASELAAIADKHSAEMLTVQQSLDESRATITAQLERLEKLEQDFTDANKLIEALESEKAEAQRLAEKNAQLAAELEKEVATKQEAINKNQETLMELRDLHNGLQTEIDRLSKKEQKHSRVVEELEQQLAFTFDQNQDTAKRLADVTAELEQVRQEKTALIEEVSGKGAETRQLQDALNEENIALKTKLTELQMELSGLSPIGGRAQRSNSTSSNSNLRKSPSATSLPSPPPIIPLPPLPNTLPNLPGTSSPTSTSPSPIPGQTAARRPSKDFVAACFEDQDARIRTLEKQLIAEKALTQTLEEALTECEKSMRRLTSDRDSLQAKAAQVQAELERTKNETQNSRYSMQAVEEERLARMAAEKAKEQLEARMQALSKKNKSRFACF